MVSQIMMKMIKIVIVIMIMIMPMMLTNNDNLIKKDNDLMRIIKSDIGLVRAMMPGMSGRGPLEVATLRGQRTRRRGRGAHSELRGVLSEVTHADTQQFPWTLS